jgi:hypothetical protein
MLVVLSAFALLACAHAPAQGQTQQQQQPPPPCSTPEYRQLDFWVGVWDVRWDASPGIAAGGGTNTISREYGGCVIQEQFDGGPTTGGMLGHSVSVYHAPVGLWRQTWVDNQGGYFALTGGPEGDRFILTNTRLSDRAPHLRMLWEDITPNSLTWRWQGSTDGATWADRWVIHYTRRGS